MPERRQYVPVVPVRRLLDVHRRQLEMTNLVVHSKVCAFTAQRAGLPCRSEVRLSFEFAGSKISAASSWQVLNSKASVRGLTRPRVQDVSW
jgi:hypothetical protein